MPDDDFVPDATPSAHDDFVPDKPPVEPSRPWSSVPGEALSNLPASAGQFATNVAQPFIHPIETAESLGGIGQGILQKTGIMSGEEKIPYADAVGKFFSDRYGGIENLKKTMATDPVGFMADVAGLLTGTGLGVRGAGAAGELARLGKTAETVGGVGRGIQAAGSAVDPISLAGTAISKTGIGKVLAPSSADARTLSESDVSLTPGQMIGGPFRTVEDAITSIPILGSFVRSGKARSVESFNKSVANQALEPIGESLSKKTTAGHALVDEVATKLGAAYDRIVPKLNFVPDREFANDMNTIRQRDVAILPKDVQDQYESIINSRMGPPARMSGKLIKDTESELSHIASEYSSSLDGAQRGLSKALNNTVMAMRSNLERNNPVHADELAKINSGWAMYSRIRGAAARRATSEGIFMPSDLLSAIKMGDRSVGKGSFAKGDALMQTFAETGQRVLPSTLPTSGTTERGMTAAGLFGASTFFHRPELLAAGTAAALPYTAPGMWGLNKLYRTRPSQYIQPVSQPAFQIGRLGQQQPQSRGGKIAAAMSIAKRMGKRKS